MPRRIGLRDDDTLGRLHDIERRLDTLEDAEDERATAAPAKKDDAKKG